jgi:hypothetical protein
VFVFGKPPLGLCFFADFSSNLVHDYPLTIPGFIHRQKAGWTPTLRNCGFQPRRVLGDSIAQGYQPVKAHQHLLRRQN